MKECYKEQTLLQSQIEKTSDNTRKAQLQQQLELKTEEHSQTIEKLHEEHSQQQGSAMDKVLVVVVVAVVAVVAVPW